MRITEAVMARARDRLGKKTERRLAPRPSDMGMYPVVGKIGRCSDTRRMSKVASRKLGIERPIRANSRASRSLRAFWRTAEITPAGTAKRTAMITASSVTSSVTGRRRTISDSTGLPVRKESPRSPRSTLPSQNRYCTGSGLSRP